MQKEMGSSSRRMFIEMDISDFGWNLINYMLIFTVIVINYI